MNSENNFVKPHIFEKSRENVMESELSPEIIEQIMEKVQDINEEGTAFHFIDAFKKDTTFSSETITNVLREGLLGKKEERDPKAAKIPLNRETWAKNARAREFAPVWFNIIGRNCIDFKYGRDRMDNSDYINGSLGGVAIIFDTSSFQDSSDNSDKCLDVKTYYGTTIENIEYCDIKMLPSKNNPVFSKNERKTRSYMPYYYTPGNNPVIYSKNGKTVTPEATGFITFFRVAPKFFKGLVFKESSQNDKEITDPGELRKRAEKIVRIMVDIYKNKLELMVPVYDVRGNLLWPKQMSYEEVKKFAEKRDKKKEE